jgi:hypothetical protein
MRTHGWTTLERVQETVAAVNKILDVLLESIPPESDSAVEDAASAIRWQLKQLIDQK